jgi:hypothetical protein
MDVVPADMHIASILPTMVFVVGMTLLGCSRLPSALAGPRRGLDIEAAGCCIVDACRQSAPAAQISQTNSSRP